MNEITDQERRNVRRNWMVLVGIFVLALSVRIGFAWPAVTGSEGFLMGDDGDYYQLAISLTQTGQLTNLGLYAYRMPLFPIMLAAVYSVLGSAPHVAYPVILVLSALTCVGVYLLGRELFGRRVGEIAGYVSIIDFNLVFYTRFLLTETLFVFLVLYAMLALERLRKQQRWQWAAITGALLGLAVLTRVNFALFVPLAFGWIIFTARPNFKPAIRNVIIMAGLVLSLWSAWIARNYLELKAFVPFTTQGGNGYYGVYNDWSASRPDLLSYGTWVNLPLPKFPQPWNEVAWDQWQRSMAMSWIEAHPGQAAGIALMQAVHFWQPDLYDASPFAMWWAGITYLLVFPAGLVGWIWALRQKNQFIYLWTMMAIVLTLMAIASLGIARFQLVLHPILIVLAVFAYVTGGQRMVSKRKHNQFTAHNA